MMIYNQKSKAMKNLRHFKLIFNLAGILFLMQCFFLYIKFKGVDWITIISYVALLVLWDLFTKTFWDRKT